MKAETRIFPKDQKTYASNFAQIQENERKVKAYCKKHKIDRQTCGMPFESLLDQAEKEGV